MTASFLKTLLVAGTVALLTTGSSVVSALSLEKPRLFARQSCPNTLSCSSNKSSDSCCSPKYGLLVLNQQWYKGLGPSDAFTLHGLWPDNCDGSYAPSNGCDSSRAYGNIESIVSNGDSNLYSDMNTYWASYTGDQNTFWSHEWSKHGTCVSTLDPSCPANSGGGDYQDVLTYFKTAVSLRSQYDIYAALANAGITPGGKYSTTSFTTAIKSALGVTAIPTCSGGSLSAVEIWFNLRGRDQYVPTSPPSSARSNCGSTINYFVK